MEEKTFRILDLFCGAGGFSYGIHKNNHFKTVVALDFNEEAANTFKRNMPAAHVITGDITQIDLPTDKTSGLKDAVRILENIPDIAICRLTASDVVRHALVQQIIAAYENGEKKSLPAQKKVYRKK